MTAVLGDDMVTAETFSIAYVKEHHSTHTLDR
jgi:hypothetical protein